MKAGIPIQKLKVHNQPFGGQFDLSRWGKPTGSYDFSKPHRHSYNEILIFFKGGGFHEIDFTKYPIKSNSIHFVGSHSVHLIQRGSQSTGATILFSDDFFSGDQSFSRFIKKLYSSISIYGHVISLKPIDFGSFRTLYEDMEKEYIKNDSGSEILLKSLLGLFLARSATNFNETQPLNKQKSIIHPSVEKYLMLVEKEFMFHRSIRYYADTLLLSAKHLNELCKRHLSLTAQKVVHQRLLLEIKRMLVHTEMPIKEICYQTGFEDPAHFNHFFRFYMELTPLQYRKNTR